MKNLQPPSRTCRSPFLRSVAAILSPSLSILRAPGNTFCAVAGTGEVGYVEDVFRSWKLWAACSALSLANVSAAVSITPQGAAQQWKVEEFRLAGAPTAANPFDPDQIVVSGTFTSPSGKATTVEGFWFQNYSSALSGGSEVLTASGAPEWRMRFLPDESGTYSLSVQAKTASVTNTGSISFSVAAAAAANRFQGIPKVAANGKYFELAGAPLVLNGANVCWHGGRGTFDYLDWFPAMKNNGENYARIWMCPWAFGIETQSNTRTNYQMNKAWQLDRTLRIGETNGIFMMLCLEYHGMFQTVPDQFGGNNAWAQNPYNTANGGPCAAPNDFFTNTTARDIYKKRLRYILARWGATPNLLCWEFFNEIDNDYNVLNATSVANWHSALGPWLKASDPYKRLVTTSLTGSSDRAEIWNIGSLEFAQYHSYGLAQPAAKLAPIVQGMVTKYHKPVIVSEYGIDSGGFRADLDPYYRGTRQGVWTGLLSGAPGTSMSWWWEEIHARNMYPLYNSAAQFLNKTALGNGVWDPIKFVTNGDPPATVGDPIPGAPLFNAMLTLSGQWGLITSGALALADTDSVGRAPGILDGFFHGSAHAELKNLCKISTTIAAGGGQMVLHLNSVSDGAIINVLVDNVSVFTKSVPNTDASYAVNNEYNVDYPIALTAGKHLIQVRNTGADWFYLDSIRIDNVQPSTYSGNWTASPISVGLKNSAESLVYVMNPAASYPVNATLADVPGMTNATIRLTNWTAGTFTAIWNDAKTFLALGKTVATTTNGVLTIGLPNFKEDVAGRIVPANRVSAIQLISPSALNLQLENPAAARTTIQSAPDLQAWQTAAPAPFATQMVAVPFAVGESARFYRVATPE